MANYPTTPQAQFIYAYSPAFKTLVTAFESGKEQRRQVWTARKRTFTLNYNFVSQTHLELLRDHFVGTGVGRLNSFNFTNPAESGTPTYTVRYDQDKFDVTCIDGTLYRCTVRLMQVL